MAVYRFPNPLPFGYVDDTTANITALQRAVMPILQARLQAQRASAAAARPRPRFRGALAIPGLGGVSFGGAPVPIAGASGVDLFTRAFENYTRQRDDELLSKLVEAKDRDEVAAILRQHDVEDKPPLAVRLGRALGLLPASAITPLERTIGQSLISSKLRPKELRQRMFDLLTAEEQKRAAEAAYLPQPQGPKTTAMPWWWQYASPQEQESYLQMQTGLKGRPGAVPFEAQGMPAEDVKRYKERRLLGLTGPMYELRRTRPSDYETAVRYQLNLEMTPEEKAQQQVREEQAARGRRAEKRQQEAHQLRMQEGKLRLQREKLEGRDRQAGLDDDPDYQDMKAEYARLNDLKKLYDPVDDEQQLKQLETRKIELNKAMINRIRALAKARAKPPQTAQAAINQIIKLGKASLVTVDQLTEQAKRKVRQWLNEHPQYQK